ncbi:hypothetical protein L227DRAFT_236285 [Lentinus tigrinus ALCF2SS1-6]|uniref:Chromo domain-containing protein n=1 Tax=Lentinus tigrinus ALCF2SS1-6 TaxID=1328759 RepID=A0A5C2S0R8_9APHY|nr:hypothetical protein L227DRAFT_236285 [Lentinus tigrinus ALCF2SS1-6]
MPDPGPSSSLEIEPYQTQFVPKENDDETLWDVIEITAERAKEYRVRWAGNDPATGKPWAQSWVPKHDCTDELIRDWKIAKAKKKKEAEKRKSAGAKSRGSTASSKTKQRSTSTSTANTTRRTRQSLANPLTPSTTTRPTPNTTSGSPASPSQSRDRLSPLRKRRRATRDHQSGGENEKAGPSRPSKRRKVEVEIVSPRREPSHAPESSYEVVAQKKLGKKAVIGTETDVEEEEMASPPVSQSKAAGKRKADAEADDAEVRVKKERGGTNDVPLSKVGPPRHLKRLRESRSNASSSGRGSSRGERSVEPPIHSNGTGQSLQQSSRTSDARPGSRSRDTATSRRNDGRVLKPPAKSKGASFARRDPAGHSETEDSSSNENRHRTSRRQKAVDIAKPTTADVSPQTRQALMQEEEENTQEAAGLFFELEPLDVPHSSHAPADSHPVPGPSKPAILRGRPSANDTFSRDGIVPETQPTSAPGPLDDAPYDPTQDDVDVMHDLPSTPGRSHQASAHGSSSSVVSKMKGRTKGKGKAKEFRPISNISPPDFTPYLVSTQFDDIEEFSSPERSARKKQHAMNPFTQDTIEEFTVDQYVDWDGGAPAEDPPTQEENAMILSHFTPSEDHNKDPQEGTHSEMLSPEVTLQEPPPTSTTQRAEADSQSQDHSVLNTHITELTAALEEKDEKLTQLEEQIGELQGHISKLEGKSAEERSAFEAELQALREASNEKAEQVSLLESQLVELQLQVTQLTDGDNQRAQFESEIRELKETVEEREEQLSQLESSLVELQTEIETMQTDKEKLAQALQQHTARDGDARLQAEAALAAAQRRVTDLEQELANTQAKLTKAEADTGTLSERVEATIRIWESRLKDTEEHRDLYKKLFDDASTNAQRLAKENRALEERAVLAEGQVEQGLAMVRGTHEQEVRMLRKEVEKWKGLCQVLTEKDERTNDDVRKRAALMPTLQGENVRLRVDLQIARREITKLKEVLEDMASAREGNGQVGDDDDDEDFVPDPDEGSSSSDSSSRQGSVSSISSQVPARSRSQGDEELHVCQYVSGTSVCNATFPSAQDVIHHALQTHWLEGEPVKLA